MSSARPLPAPSRTLQALRLAAAAALLPLALGAAQAGVYKVVGPDGRVTYTDVPPPPKPAAASGAGTTAGRGDSTVTQLSTGGAGGVDPNAAVEASKLFVPEMREQAVALIFAESFRETMSQADGLCASGVANPSANFRTASVAWKQRNQGFYSRVDQVMSSSLTTEQRRFIVQQVSRAVDHELDKVRAARIPARKQWCENAAYELAGGKADLSKVPAIARAIEGGGSGRRPGL